MRKSTSGLERLMERNFLEYASYVIVDRAIPALRDGLKPVQRRLLHTLFEMNDGRFHKVANVIGETMKLHPHGDASIGDALIVLANKDYFIEKQGNFGSLTTGHRAAAARYIECRLTPLALETLYNPELTEWADSYDGRKQEPVHLPVKLPVALMLGTEGIAVGMSTRVLPHNFVELLEAQIKHLEGKPFELYPDFPQGGLMDVAEYDDGRGRVKVRARIESKGPKDIVIREVPYGVTTESLVASIEAAAQKGKIKVTSIQDFTTDRVEIQIGLPRGVTAEETLPQLFAYTDCEVNAVSNINLIHDRHPSEMTVSEVLTAATAALEKQLKAELEHELDLLEDRRHWLTLEQIFIENRVYKRIEKAKTSEAVRKAVWDGMEKFALFFVRPMTDDDVTRLLEIRIRRISAYDIAKYKRDIEDIVAAIKAVKTKLRNMKKTTIRYIEDILDRFGGALSRRTEITTFEAVDKKAVARQDSKVTFDPESGFIGTAVKSGPRSFTMSDYDRLLAISDDGTYRIFGPEEKLLLPGKVMHLERFDPEAGEHFTVVYKDRDKMCFGKRIHIHKFIKGREYRLIKGPRGKVALLLQDDKPGRVHLTYVRKPRQRVNEGEFDLDILTPTSPSALGRRLASKPVSRIKRIR